MNCNRREIRNLLTKGADSSQVQRSTESGVGGSESVLGAGATSRLFFGIGASIGKGGFPSRLSIVAGRPSTKAI